MSPKSRASIPHRTLSGQDRSAARPRRCARDCLDGPASPGRPRRALTVPTSALINRGQLTFVYLVDARGRARLRPISAGGVDADRSEVLAGLRDGDAIVTNPPPSLTDGARVAGEHAMKPPTGVAGRLAAAFIHSKLTPLVIVASLLLGVYAVLALPREEEPQIIVPMIDVFVDMPGASPTEVEQRVTRPIETAALGSARRRVPLLHLQPGPSDGRRPISRRPGRRTRARPAESEARRECDARCRQAHRRLSSRLDRSTTCR